MSALSEFNLYVMPSHDDNGALTTVLCTACRTPLFPLRLLLSTDVYCLLYRHPPFVLPLTYSLLNLYK